MSAGRPLLLDACVLLNLWASRRMSEIIAVGGFRAVMSDLAAGEALWILDEAGEREPVPHERLLRERQLELWTTIDEEIVTLVTLAARLGDGEASALAIGHGRGVPVATDDRPARRAARQLSPEVAVLSTSELLRGWADAHRPELVAHTLQRVESGACFRPPRQDPNLEWWSEARSATPTRGSKPNLAF